MPVFEGPGRDSQAKGPGNCYVEEGIPEGPRFFPAPGGCYRLLREDDESPLLLQAVDKHAIFHDRLIGISTCRPESGPGCENRLVAEDDAHMSRPEVRRFFDETVKRGLSFQGEGKCPSDGLPVADGSLNHFIEAGGQHRIDMQKEENIPPGHRSTGIQLPGPTGGRPDYMDGELLRPFG